MKHKQLIEEAVQAASDKIGEGVKIEDCHIDQGIHVHVDEAMQTLAEALIENGKAIQKVAELAKPAQTINQDSMGIQLTGLDRPKIFDVKALGAISNKGDL